MALCEYEKETLRRIVLGDLPDDPGAAWFSACEALSGHGYVLSGRITALGLDVLSRQMAPAAGRCSSCS